MNPPQQGLIPKTANAANAAVTTDATLTVVHNQGPRTHEATILRALEDAEEIYISVAFIKKHALQNLLPALQSALKAGASATIIVGGDFYLTEPEALTSLYRLCHPYHPKARAYLVQPGQETFHPKAYCAVRGQAVTMLVGSANLTNGGLRSNFELSLIHFADALSPVFEAFKSWLATARANKRVTELDELIIGAYHLRHGIYNKHTRPAERNALAEIKRQYKLDTALLQQYVKEYRADKEQEKSWAEKQTKYRQAREMLDLMINNPPATREAFLVSYGDLVGAHGGRHLWHSGSIFRAKNRVADQYPKFLAMLRDLQSAAAAHRPAEELFRLGLFHAESIPGLGPNVLTEIMNTYAPPLYAVLNKNPIGSLRNMGIAPYPDPGAFRPQKYAEYNDLMKYIAARRGFRDLSQVDHFMNYVYWKHVKRRSPLVPLSKRDPTFALEETETDRKSAAPPRAVEDIVYYFNNCRGRNHVALFGNGAFYDLALTGRQSTQARELRVGQECVVASIAGHNQIAFARYAFLREKVMRDDAGVQQRVLFGEHLASETFAKADAANEARYSTFFDINGNFKRQSVLHRAVQAR